MYSFSQQLRMVRRLKVPDGISRRYNCPICGHYNTLGVSNINGTLEWHCFSASCYAKGIANEGSTVDGIRKRLRTKESEVSGTGRAIPDMLVSVVLPEHIEWLKSVNSYEAIMRRLVEVFYAPADNRILFSIANGKGYTGRRIDHELNDDNELIPKKAYGPKWIKYGDTSNLFACGTGSVGVLVEDAPSACAVGIIPEYTGLALLGTSLTSQHKMDILNYEKIIVCLDPDAASKGVEIASKIAGIRPATSKIIPDDMKYFSMTQIKEILK